MAVQVIGSVFQGVGKPGDCGWMVVQDAYKSAFFIFNDNEEQFLDFHDHAAGARPPGACAPGAGNGVLRPWQCETPPRAGGIPTGSHGMGYAALTPKVQALIDRAVDAIAATIAEHGFTEVYYSSDGAGGLGASTFAPAQEVKDYIVAQIASLAQT
ncbi:hypothetical protein Dshi_2750 [Dinoroseobacter shibae DFL 12 = DSM 16493]|jgi:hypothetical protein|uniref:Uncharacterized protein n=1 Tax=Dinoroseobacter shibae (strain DSM 16493 / NCIMB 14021 / DFL 12) TaxID=398580 RepID=A8LIP2_DINSH|nr:hypothetical protein [Dinoroseobacter shibae]ABV94483.1 hypothetical protein Dshi_2750 [Dinoroseobacter shibae DFL 12 = DSM 16493]URF45909.1 hypothetical protein M8008_14170 [Dinoroseobacter shibae]URF50215.1 hypothetical protein M8007_14170 [Dinoroseobacter shibae]